ncbi:MAG TPA: beta-ketoacyl synthase N-terminal-like domain-containing protein [Tepidisphaeraceae bacterium]|nr:beta-ketoacyl synthase N-terminal-like domain-containing protein [Tepidisphaeraceae bacterium]
MEPIPHITGLGLVTPLGASVESSWRGLLEGQYVLDSGRVGNMPHADEPRVNLLALRAAEQALDEAGWSGKERSSAALLVGTSKGPVESWIGASACNSITQGISGTASRLADKLGFSAGPRRTLSAACASGLHALIYAAMLVRSGQVSRCLVVGAESSLHPMFIESFRRLGVLAMPSEGCRPFDRERSGFVMSEAAAAVTMEAANKPNATSLSDVYAVVDRFALAGDAMHLTGSDPEGRTLRRMLAEVIDRRPIDLIHAHATGTILHDPVELAAIHANLIPHDAGPLIYSHKGAMGHSLGAAGMISVVINCLIHRHGIIPGNVRTQSPLPVRGARIVANPVAGKFHRSIVTACGFGGTIAAVALSDAGNS